MGTSVWPSWADGLGSGAGGAERGTPIMSLLGGGGGGGGGGHGCRLWAGVFSRAQVLVGRWDLAS